MGLALQAPAQIPSQGVRGCGCVIPKDLPPRALTLTFLSGAQMTTLIFTQHPSPTIHSFIHSLFSDNLLRANPCSGHWGDEYESKYPLALRNSMMGALWENRESAEVRGGRNSQSIMEAFLEEGLGLRSRQNLSI